MEILEPRPKKNCRSATCFPFPITYQSDGSIHKIKGYFNGFSVVIKDPNDMKNLITMGCFGKANLSRSYPQFNKDEKEIISKRQELQRQKWMDNPSDLGEPSTKIVAVVPDSEDDDTEGEEHFGILPPQITNLSLKENVWLSLEEAFFLLKALQCLIIYYEGVLLENDQAWKLFSEADPYFRQNYVVYSFFRCKNWVVKPGIKFGGDYLLYKDGPQFYHGSYVVIIDNLDEDLKRIDHLSRRSMDDTSILGLNRQCETAAKDLLICQIIWPQNCVDEFHFDSISNITVKEVLIRRWVSTQERNS